MKDSYCPVEWNSSVWGWWCFCCGLIKSDSATNAEMAMTHMWEHHGIVVYCGIIDNQSGAYLRARPKVGAR